MNKYLIATPVVCILAFYFLFLNYTTFTEAGIMRNEISGETQLQYQLCRMAHDTTLDSGGKN